MEQSHAAVVERVVRRWIRDETLDESLCDAVCAELVAALRPDECVAFAGDHAAALAVVEAERAWTVGLDASSEQHHDAVLHELIERCAARGARRLYSGGPPRWYLRSGVCSGDDERPWLLAAAKLRGRHLDLWVDTASVTVADERAERVTDLRDCQAICGWLREEFSEAWAQEVRASFNVGGVWGARERGAWVAVAAHSGHLAAAGTFGPLATRAVARGRGHGAAVARAALRAAGERGFQRVCVPWVDVDVVRFYAAIASIVASKERLLYAVDLTAR